MGAEDGPFAVPGALRKPSALDWSAATDRAQGDARRPGLLRRRNFPFSLYSWACEHLLSTQTFFTP